MKKVLFITYYWPPSGGAGVQRSLKFVKYLPDSGIEPYVLTVDEKFASYPLHDESLSSDINPQLKIKKTKSFEPLKLLSLVIDKKRIPHGGFANSNKEKWHQKLLRFIRGNVFIPDARKGWVRYAMKEASEIISKEKIDTVFVSSPPHSSQLIGLKLKRKFNIRWIADMRDPWTDIYYYKDLLHTKYSASLDSKLEMEVLKNADEIIAVSKPINDIFLRKSTDLNPGKFHVIPNGFDEDDFNNYQGKSNENFNITYVGSIAETYNSEIFFKTFRRLVDDLQVKNIYFKMVGSSPGAVRRLINKYNLENHIESIDHVGHDSAVKLMIDATALLLIIPDVVQNEGILTGKLFEYLAARNPIIGIGPTKGSAAAIINECKAGEMFERNEEEQIYSYIKSLILSWKEGKDLRIKGEHINNYSRSSLTKNLAKIILKK